MGAQGVWGTSGFGGPKGIWALGVMDYIGGWGAYESLGDAVG